MNDLNFLDSNFITGPLYTGHTRETASVTISIFIRIDGVIPTIPICNNPVITAFLIRTNHKPTLLTRQCRPKKCGSSSRVFFLGFVMAGRSFLLMGKRKEQPFQN